MNNSGYWIIPEPSLQQMQGMEGEAVVYHREPEIAQQML